MFMNEITSDSWIIDIEKHFRVSAGPGAGKTQWMCEHIKNVLQRSKKLNKVRRVACITYTNIAVETVLARIGAASTHIEVSTIHSFLYEHIVKPYATFISTEYDLNVERMDGHDEVFFSRKNIKEWIENHPKKSLLRHPNTASQLTDRPENLEALRSWLNSIRFELASGDVSATTDRTKAYSLSGSKRVYVSKTALNTLDGELIDLKKMMWRNGRIHHDDVLFFSFQIIKKFPFVLKCLIAKFPYFIIDEFQDTSPIQTHILEEIGKAGGVVGVIGDPAQSIFGFQGADVSNFKSFALSGIVEYTLSQNWRSTHNIVDTLNSIRTDIKQVKARSTIGVRPVIIVGDPYPAYLKSQEICGNDMVYSLSRDNVTSNALKYQLSGSSFDGDFLDQLRQNDSNSDRVNAVIACIKAIELANQAQYKAALKELTRLAPDRDEANTLRFAWNALRILTKAYPTFKTQKLFSLYEIVRGDEICPRISKLTSGKGKIFYEGNDYQKAAVCVKITDDLGIHRTIHKAKGDQFDNVIVVLKDESDLSFITSPSLDRNEEHRINYVGVSRAKENLFINVPSLGSKTKLIVSKHFDIMEL